MQKIAGGTALWGQRAVPPTPPSEKACPSAFFRILRSLFSVYRRFEKCRKDNNACQRFCAAARFENGFRRCDGCHAGNHKEMQASGPGKPRKKPEENTCVFLRFYSSAFPDALHPGGRPKDAGPGAVFRQHGVFFKQLRETVCFTRYAASAGMGPGPRRALVGSGVKPQRFPLSTSPAARCSCSA